MTTTPDFAPLFKLYDMLASGGAHNTVREMKDAREDALVLLRAAFDVTEHLGAIQNARAKVESGLDAEVE